jgi:hypothetical protein
MLDTLRQLYPRQMQALRDAKANFEQSSLALDHSSKAGDTTSVGEHLAALKANEAKMAHCACTLGLAIAAFLETAEPDGAQMG